MSSTDSRVTDPPLSSPSLSPAVAESVIVVADDDRLTREAVVAMLNRHGYDKVEAFDDGHNVIERASRGDVDCVLLDVVMPKMNGLETCRVLKSMHSESFLPVVLVTVKSDTASRVEGLKIGADDYVCKPFDEQELVLRIQAMLRIKKLHDHVRRARAKLEQLSVFDELTGLYNYRYLHSRLKEEFKRAERYHDPLACMVIDIDGLSAVNEAGGREAGDQVIISVADGIRRTVREVDVVARFGGDEYLLVLPSTHFAGSVTVAERIWEEAALKTHRTADGAALKSTVSIGVAMFPSRDVRTKDALLRAADSALRRAKRDGGNRICVFQQEGYLYTPLSGPSAADSVEGPTSPSTKIAMGGSFDEADPDRQRGSA